MEEYSSWGRGHSAKVLGRVIGAGVRISPPPPIDAVMSLRFIN